MVRASLLPEHPSVVECRFNPFFQPLCVYLVVGGSGWICLRQEDLTSLLMPLEQVNFENGQIPTCHWHLDNKFFNVGGEC